MAIIKIKFAVRKASIFSGIFFKKLRRNNMPYKRSKLIHSLFRDPFGEKRFAL